MRKINFQNDNFYHIYNRGVDKRNIFDDEKDYIRFLVSMREFNNDIQIESIYRLNQLRVKENVDTECLQGRHSVSTFSEPLVDIVAYCLNSNHYHFLLKQLIDDGISKYMHKISMGYTKYFNAKYNRTGSLFQGAFKAVELDSTDKIIQTSIYINGNPEIHKIFEADKYPWSSYLDYLGQRNGTMCNKDIVLNNFRNISEYKKLTEITIKEIKEERQELKEYYLEK